MRLPLSAGRTVMVSCVLRGVRALVSWVDRLGFHSRAGTRCDSEQLLYSPGHNLQVPERQRKTMAQEDQWFDSQLLL